MIIVALQQSFGNGKPVLAQVPVGNLPLQNKSIDTFFRNRKNKTFIFNEIIGDLTVYFNVLY